MFSRSPSRRFRLQVWKAGSAHFVRVLHEGTVVPTFEWMPLDDFIVLLNAQIVPNLVAQCNS